MEFFTFGLALSLTKGGLIMLEEAVQQQSLIQNKVTGRVKWFDAMRGIGFLKSEALPADIFIHHTNIVGEGFRLLRANNQVEFSVYQTQKGYSAKDVKVINNEV